MLNMFVKKISIEDAYEDFKNKNAIFVDVRTDQERINVHIEGSTHIDISDPSFMEKINALEKSKKYIVYCMTGNRASRTTSLMGKNGFEKVYNLKGGITKWHRENLPVV